MSNSKVRVLRDEEINKIAAGEVIENPASVVKELVENSIDSGADEIIIEIRGGGQQLIRVSDNGEGMQRDDALLSLERHATSKIRKVEDLLELVTMGFRGEALASIAAISKLTLMTSLENGTGTHIEVEGGKILKVDACGRTRGTTMEVRSLFYNVPARKKFQKSPVHNATEITRILTLLALAHPHVAFAFLKQEAQVFSLHAEKKGSFTARAKALLGDEFCEESFQVETEELRGILGNPKKDRPNRSGQYLFINGRPIFSPALSFAVKDGYGTRLAENRYPAFVLHLKIPSHLVDVNVHPQKREVRFQNEAEVKQMVRDAVHAALQETPQKMEMPLANFAFDFSVHKEEFPELRFREEAPLEEELPINMEIVNSLGVFAHFLLIQEDEELLFVDLRAGQAAIAFARMSQDKRIEKQGLLFPTTFDVSLEEAAKIQLHLDLLEEIGFSIRSIGARSFMVEAIPPFLQEDKIQEFIMKLNEDDFKASDKRQHLARLLSNFARQSKKNFNLHEGLAIYNELKKLSFPALCPQGKKIIFHLPLDKIQRL